MGDLGDAVNRIAAYESLNYDLPDAKIWFTLIGPRQGLWKPEEHDFELGFLVLQDARDTTFAAARDYVAASTAGTQQPATQRLVVLKKNYGALPRREQLCAPSTDEQALDRLLSSQLMYQFETPDRFHRRAFTRKPYRPTLQEKLEILREEFGAFAKGLEREYRDVFKISLDNRLKFTLLNPAAGSGWTPDRYEFGFIELADVNGADDVLAYARTLEAGERVIVVTPYEVGLQLADARANDFAAAGVRLSNANLDPMFALQTSDEKLSFLLQRRGHNYAEELGLQFDPYGKGCSEFIDLRPYAETEGAMSVEELAEHIEAINRPGAGFEGYG